MAACSTTGGVTEAQQQRGIRSVASLSSAQERGAYWTNLRQSADGRSNAFKRDLGNVGDFFDRHFWNYDVNDPYINYPTDATRVGHAGRQGLAMISALPIVGDVWDWMR